MLELEHFVYVFLVTGGNDLSSGVVVAPAAIWLRKCVLVVCRDVVSRSIVGGLGCWCSAQLCSGTDRLLSMLGPMSGCSQENTFTSPLTHH